jgi:hypothetical protein
MPLDRLRTLGRVRVVTHPAVRRVVTGFETPRGRLTLPVRVTVIYGTPDEIRAVARSLLAGPHSDRNEYHLDSAGHRAIFGLPAQRAVLSASFAGSSLYAGSTSAQNRF